MVKKKKTNIFLFPFQLFYQCLVILYTPIYLVVEFFYKILFYERIDTMSGYQFEEYISRLLKANHFYDITLTQGSNDYGIDILAYKAKEKYAFQCKKYSSKVGVHAVQQVSSGAMYYDCDKAVVITNSIYTSQAIRLASSLGIELWGEAELKQLMIKKQALKRLFVAFSTLTFLVILWYTYRYWR